MNWSKLSLIIKREYLTRVRTKGFLLSTLLAPLGLILLLVVPILITTLSSDRDRIVYIYDETNLVGNEMIASNPQLFQPTEYSISELRSMVSSGDIEGFVVIPSGAIEENLRAEYFSASGGGLQLNTVLQSEYRNAVREIRLNQEEADQRIREIIASRPSLTSRTITETGEDGDDATVLFFIGYAMGFIIYGAMFAYGAVIMRGVVEEKTNRIMEVVASSVKPFELLLGKVLGVGFLGLTQFALWAILGSGILAIVGPAAAMFAGDVSSAEALSNLEQEAGITIPTIGFSIWAGFIGFFILGYLIYSSLYAAIGSAIEQESDAQQLQIPIMFLIIIPILFIFSVADDPSSNLAIITSMIPFFAPILMPVRIAIIDVPFWQIGITVLLMIATFVVMIWLSSRIYRVGILMYGKKATFGELAKWMRYK